MSKIKICGITTCEEVSMMNALKPDYIGFVFARSKRQVTSGEAQTLRRQLSPDIKVVGVFVNEPIDRMMRIVREVGLDFIQLHGDEDALYRKQLKQKINLPIIQAMGVDQYGECPVQHDYLELRLFDFKSEGQYGGTGQRFDWGRLKAYEFDYFLAGGVNAHNIEEALRYKPYCIDVSSGAEKNGKKDLDKTRLIIQKVRDYHG
ncbi:MAG: phosphoribosylanthranilate isomerase [Cellulosilyticaceae bacterium]